MFSIIVIRSRYGYSDQDVWRESLGPFEPLRPYGCSTDCLDAPEWLSLGATVWSSYDRRAIVKPVPREPSRWD